MARTDPNLRTWPDPDGHRTAERRSRAMHVEIAAHLDEAGLANARARVDRWLVDGGPVDPRWAAQWHALLAAPLDEVVAAITRDDPETVQLRQTTPFAGALSNATRWRIIREVG